MSSRILLAGLPLLACVGAVEPMDEDHPGSEPAAPGTPGPRGGAAPPPGIAPPPPPPPTFEPGPRPLQRLSRREYDNTVRDLLGDKIAPARSWTPETSGTSGFLEPIFISGNEAESFIASAQQLAENAVANLPALLGCDPAKTGEDPCLGQFVPAFGRRAFRRPLEPDETRELLELYRKNRTTFQLGVSDSVRLLVEAMLQSPRFLFHHEAVPRPPRIEAGVVELSAHELAARLSYLLWGTAPDAPLADAADQGKLKTPAEIEAQVKRLLADSRADETIADFFRQLLQLDHAGGFDAALGRVMLDETRAFVSSNVLRGDGKLATLLTSSTSFVNDQLGKVYGVVVTDPRPRQTVLDPAQRFGLLTQGSFLSSHAEGIKPHLVKRGHVVWSRLLCGSIPPPPDDPAAMPKPLDATRSTRDQFVERTDALCAKACHGLINPPGFALENYDGTGRWRSTDAGKPVDSSGTIPFPIDGIRSFANGREFVQLLARSADAQDCMARQWRRYALAREELATDRGAVEQLGKVFGDTGGNIRSLMIAVAQSGSFTRRTPSEGEGSP